MDYNNTTSTEESLMFPAAIDYVQGIITAIITISSICINSLILFLVIRYKKLHQRAFYLALELTVMNLIFTILVLPIVVVGSVARQWILGDIVCRIQGGINSIYYPMHFFLILVLTLDRFFTIFMPFFYDRNGNKIAVGMSLCVWLMGLYRMMTDGVFCTAYSPIYKRCNTVGSFSAFCNYGSVFISVSSLLAGVVLPIVLYVAMYLRGRQLDHKVLTGEEYEKRQFNKRVLKTFLIIFIVIGGVGVASIGFFVWITFFSNGMTLGVYIVQTLVVDTMLKLLTISSPIIILRNKDIRNAYRKE